VVDEDADRLSQITAGNIDLADVAPLPPSVKRLRHFDALLDDGNLNGVSICLPTHLHRRYAVAALEAGLDVVCEKPMALNLEDCDAMIEASRANGRRLFIAQCIRFWPEYEVLERTVRSGDLGDLMSLSLHRLSAPPGWGGDKGWFWDGEKSGGCLFDLHVHDLDFLHQLLGEPESVQSRGLHDSNGINTAVTTLYHYPGGPLCCSEGSWLRPAGFKMSYFAVFERGELQYDSSAAPTISRGEGVFEPIELPEGDGYSREYDYFIRCLAGNEKGDRMTPQSARTSIKIALAEARSIRSGKPEPISGEEAE